MSDEAYTIFCRNLAENVTESILYELFLQAGPVEDVRIPMTDGRHRNYGFVVYKHKCSVKYALELFKDTRLYGKTIALQNRTVDAERDAEMRNKSWRNDEVNSLRGGPPNISRFSDMNVLMRGGSSLNYSRNDDLSSLRGGSMGFFQRDMFPPDFNNGTYSSLTPQPGMNISHSRYINPYSSPYPNYPVMDLKGSSNSYDRNEWSQDRYDRKGRDNSRNDWEGSRRDRRNRDNSSRKDRFRDNDRNDLRSKMRRSKSRDRSPMRNKNDKIRPR